MAEQATTGVASAVVNGIIDWALTTVIWKLRSRSRSRPAAAHEKLQRLETLVLKLRCAVEVSEKHAIGSASLLEWRDRLREAAAEAGAVVLDFQRRVREEGGEAASTTSAPGQRQQQPAAAIASTSNLYFTRSALSGMAQRVRDVARRLLSTDEEMKKLDGALEKMERLSPDIAQFLLTLHLEVSTKLDQRRRLGKRSAPAASTPADERRQRRRRESKAHDGSEFFPRPMALHSRKITRAPASPSPSPSPCWCCVESSHTHSHSHSHRVTRWDSEHRSRKTMQLASSAETAEDEARALASVLEPTLRCLDGYIKATDDIDMEGLESAAEWAAVLREAVERGNAVLQTTLRPGSDAIHEQAGGGALEEDGELYSFARAVEGMSLNDPFWWTYALHKSKQ